MPMTNKMISEKVNSAITRIRTATEYNPLLRLYDNATKYAGISEFERELIIEEIELKLRDIAPSHATKIFGPKDAEGRKFLESAYLSISKEFDLGGNGVQNGVKVGGDMIAGRKHVDLYLSYKNTEKWHIGLSWLQDDIDAEPYLRVRKYKFGVSNLETLSDKIYKVSDARAALDNYRIELLDAFK